MDSDLPCFSQNFEIAALKKRTTKKTRRKVQEAPEYCEICLSKSTGYHYEVVSCNRCKMFFRRIIIEKLNYNCKFQNRCFTMLQPGDPVPKCPSCRFKKCIEAGMNPLGIQSELRKEMERARNDDLPMVIEKPRQTIEVQVGELIDKMIRLDIQSEKFRDCTLNPEIYPTLKDCVKQKISILSIADKYGRMIGWPLNNQDISANKHRNPIIKRWSVYELWTQLETAKALPFFSLLSESDRFFLFRDTLLMSTNLTKAFSSYKKRSDRLMRPDGLLYFDSFFPFHEKFRSLFCSVGMRCLNVILRNEIDNVEFVLLRVLVLTNPAVSDLSDDARKQLTEERQKYAFALFQYVMARHGASGPARFGNILGIIDVLEHQQKDQRDLNFTMSLSKHEKFVTPIFDDVMKH